MAPHHSPIAPQPQTTLTLSTFNLININYDNLWLHTLNVVESLMWIGKNSLNNFICHLSWLKKLSPIHIHPLKTICEFLNTLSVIIFWVRVTRKMLNVNYMKIHSIILSVTCHGLRNFHPTHTHPLKTIHEFLTPYQVIIFWVRVTHKMLNVNCIKIHSIILSVTCHGLRKYPLLIHIPSYPFVNFLKPYKLLFFKYLSWVTCKMYQFFFFFELESLKMLVNWEKFTQ